MTPTRFGRLALGVLVFTLGCDGQQYVSPDTVALVVKNDKSGAERLNRCNYIPVLIGSQVQADYVVENQLQASLTITRDLVSVMFKDAGSEVAVQEADTLLFEGQAVETLENPPSGYTVQLSSPCTPPAR